MFRPSYRYTAALLDSLLALEAARSVIDVLPLPRAAQAELRDHGRRTQQAAIVALNGGEYPGYAAACALAAQKSEVPPDELTLSELHTALTGESGSVLRATDMLVYDQDHRELIYVTPEPADILGLVSDLLDWLDQAWDGLPAVILAGILQQEIELIQPYPSGNAEMARIAAGLVLQRKGYGLSGYVSVEDALAARAESFDAASRSTHAGVYSAQPDLTRWLEFYAAALASAAGVVRDLAVSGFRNAQKAADQPVAQGPLILRERQRQALAHMAAHGAIRSGEYQALAKIVPDTARRDFDDLLDKGLIAVRGVGRGTHYVLTERGDAEARRRHA